MSSEAHGHKFVLWREKPEGKGKTRRGWGVLETYIQLMRFRRICRRIWISSKHNQNKKQLYLNCRRLVQKKKKKKKIRSVDVEDGRCVLCLVSKYEKCIL